MSYVVFMDFKSNGVMNHVVIAVTDSEDLAIQTRDYINSFDSVSSTYYVKSFTEVKSPTDIQGLVTRFFLNKKY